MKILLVLSFVSTVFAGASLYYFHASSQSDETIKLEWQTQNEINLKHFIIERSTPNRSFIAIATIQPTGDNSYYSYIDESAYKTTDLVFIYRLKIVDKDNVTISYSSEVTVSHNISDVKRTWGSIKAMFR